MTTSTPIEFSALPARKTIDFIPGSDHLSFADGVEAANVVLQEVTTGLKVTFGGKFVILKDVGMNELVAGMFTFANGSEIAIGTSGGDLITEDLAYGDQIYGFDGSDTLSGYLGNDLLFGGNGSDELDGGSGTDTMVGGLGNDTCYVDSSTDKVTELAGGGTADKIVSSVNYSLITSATQVENLDLAEGSALNATGTNLANMIDGNSNDNRIEGLTGNDTLTGGCGNDTMLGAVGADSMEGGAGCDSLIGAEASDQMYGGSGRDFLDGGAAADTLDGGSGADTMNGGLAGDWYVVDNACDSIVADIGGIDTVQLSDAFFDGFSYTLAAGLDYLDATTFDLGGGFVFAGNAIRNVMTDGDLGNAFWGYGGADVILGYGGDDTLNGGDLADSLMGGEGNDSLVGGAAADVLNGGNGSDTYVVDSGGDSVQDSGGTLDTVNIEGSTIKLYTLGAGLENLSATGSTVTTGLKLNGNTGDNDITGSGGNDSITGGAGNDTVDGNNGNDTMNGGAGSDHYVVNSNGDVVNEVNDGGTNTVEIVGNLVSTFRMTNFVTDVDASASSYGGGTTSLVGNALANHLTGTGGNDSLVGGGGADNLIGGYGDDVFVDDYTTGGFFGISGGIGTDTLRLTGGQDVDFTAGVSGYINGIAVIDMATDTGANTIALGGTDVAAMSDTTEFFSGYETLVIDGDGSDAVELVGGNWINQGEYIFNADYDFWYDSSSSTSLLISDDIINIISGTA